MDYTILIVMGAALLQAAMILLPAERQIYRVRQSEAHYPYAARDHRWSSKLLQHLLTFGFSLLVLYILLSEPEVVGSFLQALSGK